MASSRNATSARMPARMTMSSAREPARCAGSVGGGEAHAPAPRRRRTRAADSGGSATASVWPSRMPRSRMTLAEKSAAIVDVRARPRARSVRAAEGAEEIEQLDASTAIAFGVAGLDAAHAHLLRPQPERHALRRRRARRAPSQASVERADPHAVRARRPRASRKFIAPTKSATKAVAGRRVDLRRRADLLDRAVVHHHDAVGHGQRLLLVVRDHDGGDAEPALQRLDLVAQAHAHARVERRQRLVEQQQRRARSRARAPARRAAAGRRRAAPDIWRPARAGRPAAAARPRARRSRARALRRLTRP